MNNFKILSLEGVTGVGKTTQSRLVKTYLENIYKNNKFQIFTINLEQENEVCSLNKKIGDFLECEENVAILDGTVASVIARSDLKNNHFNSSINRLDLEVKSYLNLIHKYRAINCLIQPDRTDFLQKRTGLPGVYLDTFLKAFDYFEQAQIASNLSYLRVPISEQDKIITVFEKIKKTLNL